MSSSSVLVVGANRGIGLGLVTEVILRDPNATVYATARDIVKSQALVGLQGKHPTRLILLQLDMLDEPSVAAAVAELKKHTSSLTKVIINSGVWLGKGRIEDLSAADLLGNFANVVGPHNLTKAFSPFLLAEPVEGEKRKLVYISSGVATIAAFDMVRGLIKDLYKTDYIPNSGYAASKTGLNMLGRSWADSLEPRGVSVLLMHPGAVETDMMRASDGTISVAESAKGVLDVIEGSKLGNGSKGMLSYDGQVLPW